MLEEKYHRQNDRKKSDDLTDLVKYIVNHDRDKKIIMDDYRKLPTSTKLQKRYYQAAKRRITKKKVREVFSLFEKLERENPGLKYEGIKDSLMYRHYFEYSGEKSLQYTEG